METADLAVPPKQTQLLDANVGASGTVVAVSSTQTFGYALIEGTDRVTRRALFATLKRGEVELPFEPQRYITCAARVDYGVWDGVHTLDSAGNDAAGNAASRPHCRGAHLHCATRS